MVGRRPSASAAFVGRDAELASLRAGVEALFEGSGAIVLLTGEPGIGKTRIAREAVAAARTRDVDVLWGASYEEDWSPPFGPWVEALRSLAESIDPVWLLGRLGPGAALLADLVPELRPAVPAGAAPVATGEQSRYQLYDAVGRLLGEVAERRPVVIVLDDLHWADGDSLGLFRHVARLTSRLPILLLGTYRDGGLTAHHPLVAALAELRRNSEVAAIALGPLSPEEVSAYLFESTDAANAGRLSQAIHAETSGNPFFVCELARHLVEGGTLPETADALAAVAEREATGASATIPEGVRRVIAHRLAGLSERTVTALRAACVFSGAIEFDVLSAITGQEEDALLDSLDDATRAGILRPVPGGREQYEFTHAIVRHTLYDEMTPGRRIRVHRRAAEALERVHSSDVGPHVAELAHHYLRAAPAGDAERAIEYARLAGEHAYRVLAFEEAARLFEQALSVLEAQNRPDAAARCELLLALGQTRMRSARAGAGREAYERAATAARETGQADLLARAALGYATFFEPGEVEGQQIGLLREALEAVGPGDSATRAALMGRLAHALYWSGAVEERATLSREAIAMARRLGDKAVLARTLNSGGFAMWGPDGVRERLANAAEVLDLAIDLQDEYLVMAARAGRIVAYLELGDIDAVDAEIDAYGIAAERSGYPPRLWMTAMFRAMRAILSGRLADAERLVGEAIVVGRRTEDNSGPPQYFGLQMFALRLLQGRGEELAPMLTDLATRQPHIPAYPVGLALLHAEAGRREPAARLFEQYAADGFAGIPRDLSWLITMTNLAQVCAFLGDTERAAMLYQILGPHAEQCIVSATAAACYGSTARSLGLLATTLGRWEDADAQFLRAAEQHERMGALPWVARTAYDHALSLMARASGTRDSGARERAGALLKRSLEIAREIGMGGLAGQAAERLEVLERQGSRTGEGPRRPVLPAGITAREADVLRLIARGHTNKEVADELVLSLATVERHITNLYAKIDARGRADATAFALRHHLLELDELEDQPAL